MRHILLIVTIFSAILVLLAVMPSSSSGGEFETRDRIEGTEHCCSFELGGEQKTCAAVSGKSCDTCLQVCAAAG